MVDDDREIVDSIAIFLSGENYTVLKAYNGIDALDILSDNEVHLTVIGIIGIAAKALCIAILEEYQSSHLPPYILRISTGAAAALGSAILLNSMLSIVRKIKCGIFIKTSIICRAVKWAWRIFVKVIKWIFAEMKDCKSTISGAVSKKTGIIFTVMLLTYTATIGLFGVLLPESAIFLLFAIIIFGLAAFVLAYEQGISTR